MDEISYPPYGFLDEQNTPQNQIWLNPYQMFIPTPNLETSVILKKIQENSIPLSKLAFVSRGIELGYTHPLLTSEKKATEYALLSDNRPCLSVIFPQVNAYTVGQFIYMYEVTTIFAGALFGINPFLNNSSAQ